MSVTVVRYLCSDLPRVQPVRAEFLYGFSFVSVLFSINVDGVEPGPVDCARVLSPAFVPRGCCCSLGPMPLSLPSACPS